MINELLIPTSIVIVGLGLMICIKLYNDKIKSIIVSNDKIQIDFKLLHSKIDNLINKQTNEESNEEELTQQLL